MDKIFWNSWRIAQQRSEIWGSNSSGLSCSSLVGNPHYRIPNSSVRTNSSETRRTSSLSLKKLTDLYEISNGFTRKDWVGVGFWDEHHLEIGFLSITPTPFNSTVFPMTQERENEILKTRVFTLHIPRMITKSSRSHQFLHFQSLQENQSLQLKTFIFRGRQSL